MKEPLYKPSKWGMEFHALQQTEALGAGSVGPGKTEVLIHEPVTQIQVEHARCTGQWDLIGPKGFWLRDLAEKHPIKPGESTAHVLYLRRSLGSTDQVFKRILKMARGVDPGIHVNQTKKIITFTSGLKYEVGHCYNIGDYMNYYSNEYSMLLWDELVQFDEEQYVEITTRLRSADMVIMELLKNRSMSNPLAARDSSSAGARVRDPHWVRKRFVAPAPEGRVTLNRTVKTHDGTVSKLTRIYLPAKLWDNPNKEFVKNYEIRLQGLPAHKRKALLEGDWWVTADSYFGEAWDPTIHVCKPFKIPGSWKIWRSMDWGYKSQGVIHWWAMDDDDNAYCIYEYNFRMKLVDKVAEETREIERDILGVWGRGKSEITGPADTQLWEERGDKGESKAQTFLGKGIGWTKASKGRRAAAERITARLVDHGEKTHTPGLVIFSTCRKLIETLPSLPADPDDPEVPQDGGPDHWFDSAGYSCAFASRGRKGIPSRKSRRGSSSRKPKGDRGRSGYGF